jgi:hypothetical protein
MRNRRSPKTPVSTNDPSAAGVARAIGGENVSGGIWSAVTSSLALGSGDAPSTTTCPDTVLPALDWIVMPVMSPPLRLMLVRPNSRRGAAPGREADALVAAA